MDKNVDDDPDQYRDEWFETAVLPGKEFQLPNLSRPLFPVWFGRNKPPQQPHRNLSTAAAMDTATASGGGGNHHASSGEVVAAPTTTTGSTTMVHNNQVQLPPSSITDPLRATNSSIALGKNTLSVPNSSQSHHCNKIGHSQQKYCQQIQRAMYGSLNGSSVQPFPTRNLQYSYHLSPQIPQFGLNSCIMTSIIVANPAVFTPIDTQPLYVNSHGSINNSSLTRNLFKPNGLISHLRHQLTNHNVSRISSTAPPLSFNGTSLIINHANVVKPSFSFKPSLIGKINGTTISLRNQQTLAAKNKGKYKCTKCNKSFPSGSALGGHLSSHAKKRKLMEALRSTAATQSSVGFGTSSFFALQQPGSADHANIDVKPNISAITGDSKTAVIKSDDETKENEFLKENNIAGLKIKENEANSSKEAGEKSLAKGKEVDDDGSSPPCKIRKSEKSFKEEQY